jgi:hypothetical protein
MGCDIRFRLDLTSYAGSGNAVGLLEQNRSGGMLMCAVHDVLSSLQLPAR